MATIKKSDDKMKKKNATENKKPSPRKAKQKGEAITTTSVAFKTHLLDGLKNHDLVTKRDRSVSWIVNQLSEKFLAGGITLE